MLLAELHGLSANLSRSTNIAGSTFAAFVESYVIQSKVHKKKPITLKYFIINQYVDIKLHAYDAFLE